MNKKVWHKALHKRKVWKQMSILSKIIYYMQPFLEHLLDTWLQPIPFPTIIKFLYSCILGVFILLPMIYPSVVLLIFYATWQFILQRHFDVCFPSSMDLLAYVQHIFNFKITNERYKLFLLLYMERWRIVGTAIASSIDYLRLAICLLFGN